MWGWADAAAVLRDLRSRISSPVVALAGRDGRLIAAAALSELPAETIAVLCATIVGAAGAVSEGLARSPPTRVVVEGSDSCVLMIAVGRERFLTVVADRADEVGPMLGEIERFAGVLASI
ncbi:MAG TPA: roadblock/LC7 domain-containing protein [Thermoplasmata archaeon]|nr:roadblock/LC7 domain-containing protein [Thermoplasmata archaeon]